ncbi:MAG: hypothetical protein M0Q38_04810 [Bacteroidales bacterium]|jgi:hypothetical protein|nr:hypothetical protein [Bacteroidales bacterium]
MLVDGGSRKLIFAALSGLVLLGVFILWNGLREEKALHKKPDLSKNIDREQLPDTTGFRSRRLVFYDFEWGNPEDTATHLFSAGYNSKQSFCMKPWVPFAPGLWIRFRDLLVHDSSWLRATGYVWFSCPPAEVKCSLVATCNHNGVNFKYMSVPLEMENLVPNRWNKVTIDYRIPPVPDKEDVLQAYFWNRGTGKVLVDDFEVRLYEH